MFLEPTLFNVLRSTIAIGFSMPASTALSGDWTGDRDGGQLGEKDHEIYLDEAVGPNPAGFVIREGSGETRGIHVGYDRDPGDWVIGAEADADSSNLDMASAAGGPLNSLRQREQCN
jgi:hypothetical protein